MRGHGNWDPFCYTFANMSHTYMTGRTTRTVYSWYYLTLLRELLTSTWNCLADLLFHQVSPNLFVLGTLTFMVLWNYLMSETR